MQVCVLLCNRQQDAKIVELRLWLAYAKTRLLSLHNQGVDYIAPLRISKTSLLVDKNWEWRRKDKQFHELLMVSIQVIGGCHELLMALN